MWERKEKKEKILK